MHPLNAGPSPLLLWLYRPLSIPARLGQQIGCDAPAMMVIWVLVLGIGGSDGIGAWMKKHTHEIGHAAPNVTAFAHLPSTSSSMRGSSGDIGDSGGIRRGVTAALGG